MKNFLAIFSLALCFPAFAQGALKVDLRPLGVPVKDFGKKEFKSSAFALTSAVEIAAKQQGISVVLDPQLVYKNNGESEMKKQINRFEYEDVLLKIDISKFNNSDKDAFILKQLDKGKPVILTLKNPPTDLIKCAGSVVMSKKTKSDNFGVLVMGYTSDTDPMLLIQNAAGNECGDRGYQYMPLSMCSTIKKIGCESFVIESVDVKIFVTPTPIPTPTIGE